MIKCPNCGESYYSELYSTCTAVYYPAIYKDGVNQNPNGNTTTTYCECINCHYEFSYKTQYGKIFDIVLGKKRTPVPVSDYILNNFSTSNSVIDSRVVELPTKITATKEDIRAAEIERLERELESVKQQLAEVKANPEWQPRMYL